MTRTYVVGDIQGCRTALDRLLDQADFRPGLDRLLLLGDLVNRGPDNLGVLRRAMALQAEAVLGNHDLHLLARAHGLAGAKPGDTLEDVLEAPDLEPLVSWLVERPLVLEVGSDLLVHAGFRPDWDRPQALARARRVERRLRTEPKAMLDRRPAAPPPLGPELAQDRADLGVFTRIRAVGPDGCLDSSYSGPLDQMPDGLRPWFRASAADLGPGRVLFGHWSALGLHREGPFVALDSGCVWGRELTAFRLEDEAVFRVPCTPGGRSPSQA